MQFITLSIHGLAAHIHSKYGDKSGCSLSWIELGVLYTSEVRLKQMYSVQKASKSTPTSASPLPADGSTTAQILSGPNGVLAVCSSSGKPEPDYDPMWALRAFVSLFPNGCGEAPVGTKIGRAHV